MDEAINPTQDLTLEDTNYTGGDYFTPYRAGIVEFRDKNDFINYNTKFNFISVPVRKVIFDFSTAEFIEEKLGTKFGLDEIQKKEIANLIREVLLGNIFIGDFTKSIQEKLNLDEGKSKDIASMIVGELLSPALESVKAVQRAKFPERISQMKTDPPPQPTQTPIQPRPVMPPQTPPPPVQKPGNRPLEEELEKVASIIDLRNKP